MNSFRHLLATTPFVILVELPSDDDTWAAAAIEGGAHGLLVRSLAGDGCPDSRVDRRQEQTAAIRRIVTAAQGRPVGICPGNETIIDRRELDTALAEELSFFRAQASRCPGWLLDVPLASMIALGPDFTAERAASLQGLGVDAVEASIVARQEHFTPLTIRNLTDYALIAAATDIPTFVPTDKSIEPDDLPRLRHVGIRGLIITRTPADDTPPMFTNHVRSFTTKVPRPS